MLIIFASIAVLGVTVFISEMLSRSSVIRTQSKCIYLAQAGIHNALFWFKEHDRTANGYFTLGRTNVDSQNFFVLGATAADLLMVNTSNSSIGGTGRRDLLGLRIQNATNSNTITIDRMIITWNNSRILNQILINGSTVFSGNLTSPANANITNFTLNTTPTIYNINRVRFSGDMRGTTISIEFVMTDSSTRTLTVFPASNNYNFTLKSTGKTTSSNIYRTIKADYNALTSKIIDYDESNTQITP